MAVELATAYVSIVPSARGIEKNLANELAPVSAAAAAEGTKAGKALGGNVAKGLNSSIGKLSGLAAGFGVPFAAQLATINSRFDLTSAKASTFAATLANIGKTELVAAGVGLAVVGTSAVHAADQFEISRARLETAVSNTGGSFEDASKGVGTLDDSFVKLGFNTSDTENALSRLTSATGSVGKATQLMGLAADIARGRNLDLTHATDLLAKASLGNYLGLRKLGIVSKEQIANFHSLADVTDFLGKKFGGQSAAFADTFAGKMAALKAQANQLEVTIGSALIPRLQSLASGTVGAVQGFEHLNDATGGWLGKLTLGLAAVPAAVFAIGKLDQAGAAVGSQFSKLGGAFSGVDAALTSVSASTESAVVTQARMTLSQNALTAATARSAAANAEYDAAMAEYVSATDGGVAAAQRLVAAEAEATAALEAQTTAAAEVGGATTAGLAEGTAAFGGFGLAVAAAIGSVLAFQHQAKTGKSALTLPSFVPNNIGPIPLGFGAPNPNQSDDAGAKFAQTLTVTQESADRMGLSLKQAQAAITATGIAAADGKNDVGPFIDAIFRLGNAAHLNQGAQAAYTGALRDTIAALSPSQRVAFALSAAQKQYADDLAHGHIPAAQLAVDKQNLTRESAKEAAIQGQVNSVTDQGAASASKAGFAFLGLGKGIDTAAQALDAINAKAFSGIRGKISVDTAQTGVQDAIDALNNPDAGSSSGGGGGGETATAKALDAIQKNLTLRDSERGIAQASQAVKDAQEQLTNAQQDQNAATAALTTAQENYRTTLQGVARDSKAAKDATDALTQAQNDKAGAALDVNAAKRALATAKNDKDLLALAVKDARDKLAQDKGQGTGAQFVETPTGSKQISSGGADAETTRKDQIALNDAIIAQTGANDSVKRAELDLSNARLAAKQKTQDAAEAQRVYNGTINGFPPASAEAKAAQQQLTDAQRQAETAADGVRQAQDQLTTATNGTADAYLALLRAQADVDGKLTASTGAAAAGKKLDSLKTRTDAAVTAILGLADASEKADIAAGHSFGYSIQQEIGVLRAYAAANPLLAHAFDGALAELQAQFNTYVDKQIQKTGVDITAFQHPGRASGGPVLGSDPSGIPILAHPGEYVVRAGAVQKYGAMTMERLNAGSLPMYADGGRVSAHTLANSRPRDGWGGGDTYIVHGETIEERRIGTVIVKALQQHTSDHGYIPRVKVGG